METPTRWNEQPFPLLSILWILTMILINLAIYRGYLTPRRSESLHRATGTEDFRRALENLLKEVELVEADFLAAEQRNIQGRDRVLSSVLPKLDDIQKELEQKEEDYLEHRRHIIQTHDKLLSTYPEIRELHTAQCTLTPERRRIFLSAEESQTAAGEEEHPCHRKLKGA